MGGFKAFRQSLGDIEEEKELQDGHRQAANTLLEENSASLELPDRKSNGVVLLHGGQLSNVTQESLCPAQQTVSYHGLASRQCFLLCRESCRGW